jgi:hypothetical protein
MKLKRIEKRGERQKAKVTLEEKYAEYYPYREGAKVSNIMLVIIVIAIVGYTIASFVLQYHTGVEMSPTITSAWFLFWGTEIAMLTGIKVSKILKEKHNDEEV